MESIGLVNRATQCKDAALQKEGKNNFGGGFEVGSAAMTPEGGLPHGSQKVHHLLRFRSSSCHERLRGKTTALVGPKGGASQWAWVCSIEPKV